MHYELPVSPLSEAILCRKDADVLTPDLFFHVYRSLKGNEKQLTNGVSGGFLAFLVHAVVTSNRAMSSFCFNSLAIRADQHTGHHA